MLSDHLQHRQPIQRLIVYTHGRLHRGARHTTQGSPVLSYNKKYLTCLHRALNNRPSTWYSTACPVNVTAHLNTVRRARKTEANFRSDFIRFKRSYLTNTECAFAKDIIAKELDSQARGTSFYFSDEIVTSQSRISNLRLRQTGNRHGRLVISAR